MKALLLAGVLLLLVGGRLFAAPVSLKELEFMVRQHQPEAEILDEVSRRKLVEKPSGEFVDKLIVAGGSRSLIKRILDPGLIAPAPKLPPATPLPPFVQAPAGAQSPPQNLNQTRALLPGEVPNPKPRPGTVAAALDGKVFLELDNQLTEFSLSAGGEPKAYLIFFTRADDKPSRKFINVVRDRLNEWVVHAEPKPLEICRAFDSTALVRNAIGRRAKWALARYEEMDPRLKALCPKPETRIALITQEWEVLVNEVAPPADLAMSKVRAVLAERFKIQLPEK